MKCNPSRRLIACATVAALFVCCPLQSEPVIHKFELWGKMKDPTEKMIFYSGWTNGFLIARGKVAGELLHCLSSELSIDQAIAMIDKQYQDHPENWSRPITDQILVALTSNGPCVGKNPLAN